MGEDEPPILHLFLLGLRAIRRPLEGAFRREIWAVHEFESTQIEAVQLFFRIV